jgi:hypothetical protein
MDINIAFCNSLLRLVREDAKKNDIKLPKISTYKVGRNHYQIFVTYKDGTHLDGPFVNGHCASEAKYNYIRRLIMNEDGETYKKPSEVKA